MSELQEATKEFLIESFENLEQLDSDLVTLERSGSDDKALTRIFRTVHTIKGSCAFLGLQKLQAVAHAGEDLLTKLREGDLKLSTAIVSGLLAMVDAIRKMLTSIEATGAEGENEFRDVIEHLQALATGQRAAAAPKTVIPKAPPTGIEPDTSLTTDLQFARPNQAEPVPGSVADEPTDAVASSATYENSVRINVELLDKLMNISSEIVLARNQILQYASRLADPTLQSSCRQLNLNTSELQENVMKTRLQPIGNVWQRFPRLVRDVSQALGKQVRLEMHGNETELDKTIIEAIRDPLAHLVRNAIDHGIEKPGERTSAGKPPEGQLRLRAYHESGQVNVEISDDGAGIDPERIRQKALALHLVEADQVERMSDQTAIELIFAPGFSTAAEVSAVSGRGVGMDVVRNNIEKIGGSIDVRSQVGRGTTIHIRIPLTLAIIKVLIVTSAGERYAIPQVSIVELVRLKEDRIAAALETVLDARFYRYRGRLLPLLCLKRMFDDADESAGHVLNIVVLQSGDQQFGLVVDRILDAQEIVVKPFWKELRGLDYFSGATILGDGKVVLILDVFGLGEQARLLRRAQQTSAAPEP
ncbi:MAG: chemotaxis protein CheA, partial [Gemmataceae bacterium]